MIIAFILGVLSGFSLCCMFTYVAVKNRDDEIELLNKKIEKYDSLLYYDEQFVKVEIIEDTPKEDKKIKKLDINWLDKFLKFRLGVMSLQRVFFIMWNILYQNLVL